MRIKLLWSKCFMMCSYFDGFNLLIDAIFLCVFLGFLWILGFYLAFRVPTLHTLVPLESYVRSLEHFSLSSREGAKIRWCEENKRRVKWKKSPRQDANRTIPWTNRFDGSSREERRKQGISIVCTDLIDLPFSPA